MAILVGNAFPEGLMHMLPLLSVLSTCLAALCCIEAAKPSRSAVVVLEMRALGSKPGEKVAFYWVGRPGDAMLGLWEAGPRPQRLTLHVAFRVDLDSLLEAAARLREANIIPLDFAGEPTDEPVVFAWMPAAALFFNDPDGNLLEFLSLLPDAPQRLGVVAWSRWKSTQLT
jgi:lactoylglutathione lyase